MYTPAVRRCSIYRDVLIEIGRPRIERGGVHTDRIPRQQCETRTAIAIIFVGEASMTFRIEPTQHGTSRVKEVAFDIDRASGNDLEIEPARSAACASRTGEVADFIRIGNVGSKNAVAVRSVA